MIRLFAATFLGLMTLCCHADDRPLPPLDLHFRDSTLLAEFLEPAPEHLAPPVNEIRPTLDLKVSEYSLPELKEEEDERSLRSRLCDALGLARLLPQGHFHAGGLLTRWHLAAPAENTVEFRFEARW